MISRRSTRAAPSVSSGAGPGKLVKVAVAWPLALAALTGLNLLTVHHLEDLGFIFIYGPVLSFVGLALAGVAAFINWHNPRLVTLALVLNGVLAFIGLIFFFSHFNSLA